MHDYQSVSPDFHDTCIFLVSGYNITIKNSKFRNCADQDLFMQDWPGLGLHDVTIENNWFAAPCAETQTGATTFDPATCAEQNNLTISFSGRNGITWTNFFVRYNTILGSIDVGNGDMAGWVNTRIVGNVGEFPAAEYFKTLPDPIFPSCTGVLPGLTWSHNVWLSTPCGPTDKQVTDLGLVDPANFDYRLKSTSPAIDAGDPNDFPATDIFGQTRPLGSAPDAGAVESH